MGYKDAYELHMTYMQQGFLHDAYGEHPSLKCIQEKLKTDNLTLKSIDPSLIYSKGMTKQFTNN